MPIESAAAPRLPARRSTFDWRWLYDLAAAALVGLLFYLGELPWAGSLFPEPWDKLAHFACFFTLAVFLRRGGLPPWAAIAVTSLVGALDEWHQSSLPGRSADVRDFLTDVSAAALAMLVLRWRSYWIARAGD